MLILMALEFAPIRNATSAVLDREQDRLAQAMAAMCASLPSIATTVLAADLVASVARQTHDRQSTLWAFWSLVNSGHLDFNHRFEVTRTSRRLPTSK